MLDKKMLIKSLKKVRKEAKRGTYRNERVLGICYQWGQAISEMQVDCMGVIAYNLVTKLSCNWQHHTGIPSYPVQTYSHQKLWIGTQLDLRLSLIEHLLMCLREMTIEEIMERLDQDSQKS